MQVQEQFKGIIGEKSLQYTYDRLTGVVQDFVEADEAVDAAHGNKADLAARKVELETEIKLDESTALMDVQGEGKNAFVEIGGKKVFLSNEQTRDAYRRTYTKDKRTELAKVEAQLARIDIEIYRAKDRYRTAADASDSLKAVANIQAGLLATLAKMA